jgi:hypothetical protein
MAFLADVPVLHGSLVRLEPLSVGHGANLRRRLGMASSCLPVIPRRDRLRRHGGSGDACLASCLLTWSASGTPSSV